MENNISSINKQQCTGCSACYSICPRHCIQMKKDYEGFEFPYISEKNCINCGKCVTVCPVLYPFQSNIKTTGYAVKHRNNHILNVSTSGGAFSAFSEWILDNKGVVFGAELDASLKCIHSFAQDKNSYGKFRGSKYVQSSMGNNFLAVKNKLKEGKFVLFTGTPCQVAGLKHYLGKEYKRLYCVDFICHGASSPKFFELYLDEIRNHLKFIGYNKIEITGVEMRHKKRNWNLADRIVFHLSNKEVLISRWDKYLIGYKNNLGLRNACFHCPAVPFKSGSDITISDYWGGNVLQKDFYDKKGVSFLVPKTDQGFYLLNAVSKSLEIAEGSVYKAAIFNHNWFEPTRPNRKRKQFFSDLKQGDTFQQLSKKYIRPSLVFYAKHMFGSNFVYRLYYYYKKLTQKVYNRIDS